MKKASKTAQQEKCHKKTTFLKEFFFTILSPTKKYFLVNFFFFFIKNNIEKIRGKILMENLLYIHRRLMNLCVIEELGHRDAIIKKKMV